MTKVIICHSFIIRWVDWAHLGSSSRSLSCGSRQTSGTVAIWRLGQAQYSRCLCLVTSGCVLASHNVAAQSWEGKSQNECFKRPSGICKVFLWPCHEIPGMSLLSYVLLILVKQVTKASPDSKRDRIRLYLLIGSVNVILSGNLRNGRYDVAIFGKLKSATVSKEQKLL